MVKLQNHILSQKRADACINYLIDNGIDSNRLSAKGMGESEPYIIEVKNGKLKPGDVLTKQYIDSMKRRKSREEAHQYNRRTDFKVLSGDFKEWLDKNPSLGNDERTIQRALIDQKGQVIPTDSKGNFIQQIN